MNNNWEYVKLKEVADVVDPHPSHRAPEVVDKGVAFAGIGDISEYGAIDYSKARTVSPKILEEQKESYDLDENSIGYGRVGTVGKVIYFGKQERDFTLSPTMAVINPKTNISPCFLKAYLPTHDFWSQVNSKMTGTTRPSVGIQQMREMLVPFPERDVQEFIGDTWRVLTSKIHNKIKTNENLQKQAQIIYQNMFDVIKNDNGSEGKLSDIAEIVMGQSPKGDTYNEDGNGTVFFQGRAEFSFRYPSRRLYTTDPKRMAKENDVLMSVRAPVGDINVAYENCCIGRGLSAIRSKDGHQSFVLYTMFSLQSKLDVFNGEGTVFGAINRDSLNTMPIAVPTKSDMDLFEEIVSPMDAAIRKNYEEICRLEAVRDSLLPRFFDGEIEIKNMI